MKETPVVPLNRAILIFLVYALEFYAVCQYLIPWVNSSYSLHPYVTWYVFGGLFTMLPLFITALVLAKRQSGKENLKARLRLGRLSKQQWKTSLQGLLWLLLSTGLVMAGLKLFHQFTGREMSLDPSFMKSAPFSPEQWFIVPLWMAFFTFNILGEEFLWRGYIQAGMEAEYGRKAWMINSALWLLFHVPFGLNMLVMLVPTLVIVPCYFCKTKNTWTGVIIHGLFNGSASVFLLIRGFTGNL